MAREISLSRFSRVAARIIEEPRILVGRLKGLHSNHCYYCLTAKKLLKKPVKTIIDVGANDGVFIMAGRWVFPDAKIYAFEPLEEFYNKIRKIDDVIAFNFGL